MVLTDSSFSDSPQSTPTDQPNDRPFASPSQPPTEGPLRIHQDHIYKIGYLTQFLCFFTHNNYLSRVNSKVAERVENARVLTQRTPTQEEFNAMLEHCSRAIAHERLGVWLALGIWTAVLGSRIRRSPSFAKYVQSPVTPARLYAGFNAWHVAEPQVARTSTVVTGLKASFVGFAGLSASAAYAVYDEMEATIRDPRMAQFLKQVQNQDKDELQRRKAEAREKRMRMPSRGGQQLPQVESTGDVSEDSNGFEDRGSEYAKRQTGYQTGYPGTQTRETYTSPSTQNQSQGLDFFDDDDASPVAPEHKKDSIEEANALYGSAWARIRHQSVAGNAQSTRENTVVQPSSRNNAWGNSGSSRAEYNKPSEREQAQAEFDQLLDSERNMGYDSSKKGWEKW